jgi:hypothetical protein
MWSRTRGVVAASSIAILKSLFSIGIVCSWRSKVETRKYGKFWMYPTKNKTSEKTAVS